MLPIIPKPSITRAQKASAFAIAGVIDLLQIAVLPLFPLLGVGYGIDDALDFIAAILLMIVCGFRWQFILAFAVELIPGLDLFPTWTAVVLTLPHSTPTPTQSTPLPPPFPAPPIQTPPRLTATTVPPVK